MAKRGKIEKAGLENEVLAMTRKGMSSRAIAKELRTTEPASDLSVRARAVRRGARRPSSWSTPSSTRRREPEAGTMDKYETKYRDGRIALERSTLQVALGAEETVTWAARDAKANHGETLQGRELRWLWRSDPAELSEEAREHHVVRALKPFVAKPNGRAHPESLTPKLDLAAIDALEKLAKRRRASFPPGAALRWHVLRGRELPPVALMVGTRLKAGADAPADVDVVQDAKAKRVAGLCLAGLDGDARAASFTPDELRAARAAATGRLGTKAALHVVLGAEWIQRSASEAPAAAAPDAPVAGDADEVGLEALLAHFRDVAVDVFEVPLRFERAERSNAEVALHVARGGASTRVSVRWEDPLSRAGAPDPLLCAELTEAINELTQDA